MIGMRGMISTLDAQLVPEKAQRWPGSPISPGELIGDAVRT